MKTKLFQIILLLVGLVVTGTAVMVQLAVKYLPLIASVSWNA